MAAATNTCSLAQFLAQCNGPIRIRSLRKWSMGSRDGGATEKREATATFTSHSIRNRDGNLSAGKPKRIQELCWAAPAAAAAARIVRADVRHGTAAEYNN